MLGNGGIDRYCNSFACYYGKLSDDLQRFNSYINSKRGNQLLLERRSYINRSQHGKRRTFGNNYLYCNRN